MNKSASGFHQNLLDNLPYGVQENDLTGTITYSNRGQHDLLGYEYDSLLGKKIWDVMEQTAQPDFKAYFEWLVEEQPTPITFETKYVKKNGELIDVRVDWQYKQDNESRVVSIVSIISDITQQKNYEAKLHTSERRLIAAQHIAKIGSWELNLKTNQLYWTKQIYELFELDPKSFSPSYENFLNSIHPEDRETVNNAYTQSLENKRPYSVIHRLQMADGRIKWVEERCSTDFDEQGKPLISRGTVQDITKLHNAQEALRQAQARYQRVERGSNDGIWEWDVLTGYDYLSPRWLDILGYEKRDLPFHIDSFYQLVHPEDLPVLESMLDAHFQHSSPFIMDIRLLHKNGKYRWVETRGFAERNAQGQPYLMSGVISDIHQRKMAEIEIAHLASIVKYSQDFIGIANIQGEAIFLNNAGRAMVGVEDDVLFHRSLISDYFAEEDRQEVINCILPTVIQKGRWSGEFRFQHFISKEIIPVWFDIFRINDKKGKHIAFATVTRDIREKKRDEELLNRYRNHLETLVNQRTSDLEIAIEKAEKASSAKSEFLSRMSHELRTPLNAILGFAQLMKSGPTTLDEVQSDNIDEILMAGKHLLTLVNEVLDLNRLEDGRIDIQSEIIALEPLVLECVKQCKPLADSKQIIIKTQAGTESSFVRADRFRLKQVLINLINNAIKYNHPQGTAIIYWEQSHSEMIKLRVVDDGPGIAKSYHGKIFEPFERLVNAYDGIEGTGIGLAIAKSLIEAMNGRIGVESELGKGSTFWLELPI